MAGDWIKMRCDLPEDPDVIALSSRLGIEEDAAVGKLLRFWRWISGHTVDGNARGVTVSWLDRHLGAAGFAEALEAVGWLEVTVDGLRVPDFERYLSEGAKRRALTAKRVASHKAKSNAVGVSRDNGTRVSKCVPREEKRREEEEEPPIVPQGTKEDDDETPRTKPRRRKKKPGVEEYSDRFLKFWDAYPSVRKAAKRTAWQAWQRAVTRAMPAVILAAAVDFAASPLGKGIFCPGPAPWLNQDRWEDDRTAWQRSGEEPTAPHEPVEAPYKEY